MATLNSIIIHGHGLPLLTKSITKSHNSSLARVLLSTKLFSKLYPETSRVFSTPKKRNWVLGAITEDQEVAPVKANESKDEKNNLLSKGSENFEPFSTFLPLSGDLKDEDLDKLTSRAINAAIVLGFGTLAITKLFTIDHDYWHVSYLNNVINAIGTLFVASYHLCTWEFRDFYIWDSPLLKILPTHFFIYGLYDF